ncbi:uncharacterized protein LOC119982949 isoform X2 [Tripterygium wilfordii]|uniref:uncharacterized protein LOC119982949 isoform X2 n=1 Tax=Tripterygium wilfordii TaxID=458696 RepID=UPI0018F81AD5|nr:uncharacterized protein LOC119982949 isoform X2 [Tripterygium wilfordii]
MEKASFSLRSSAYLDALTQEIERKLQRALAYPSQRLKVLQELFADIALEVDDRAREMIVRTEQDTISPAEDSIHGQLCFYDVLADYYVEAPKQGKPILDLIVQLWSQSFASHIFSLLFHKWLFEVQLDNSEVLLRFSSALVQGATNVFWIDIHTNTRRFQSFFGYLLEEVALEPKRVNKIPVQIQKLKVEPVLLHYFSQLKALQGMELRMTTSTRLKACLYSFTSPGGPMYPTRTVRHAAWDALDLLFPVGRYPRHLISLFFRLLYPWYWPSSCWNFIVSCIKAVLYSVLGLIFSSWAKLEEPKMS